jgi:hypothetical protein
MQRAKHVNARIKLFVSIEGVVPSEFQNLIRAICG